MSKTLYYDVMTIICIETTNDLLFRNKKNLKFSNKTSLFIQNYED
jgi:hypothetical protein